jgi:hypothetical protein
LRGVFFLSVIEEDKGIFAINIPGKKIMNRKLVLLFFISTAFLPTVAFANAGTPLMWAGILHLLFGNAFIGIGEGLLLAILFRLNKLFCVAVMIVANYFSAWIGYAWLTSKISLSLDLDLYNAWQWMWIMVGVSYLITLFLEWPFVAFCLRKKERWFRKSLLGTLATQTASYLLIFGWYWSVSGIGLYRQYEIVQPSQIAVPCDLRLYYISETDGDVYTMDLDRKEPKKIEKLNSRVPHDMLYLKKSSDQEGRWDLVAFISASETKQSRVITILPAVTDKGYSEVIPGNTEPDGAWWNFGKVPRLEGESRNDWEFNTDFYALGGLQGFNKKDQKAIRVSLETPFAEWPVRNAVELPNGQVVFQFGVNQICIFDPEKRCIALLVKGHGPVVTVKTPAK